MAEYKKQLPAITALDRPFWDAARKHELAVYRCSSCGAAYTRVTDCHCDSPATGWVKASGRGQVYTFVVFHQLYHPAWKDEIPYNVAYIQLEEGPLLTSNIIGCPNDKIYIGMPVEVVFDDVTGEVTLPKFRPR